MTVPEKLHELAEYYGRRNAVSSELLVRVTP
jgi:hypothetical protein